MLTLYVTRHGETLWNTEKRLQGWLDSDLTTKGIHNALLLGERLKEVAFQSIYTSPSKRAFETANLIKGDRNEPVIIDENLKEIFLGDGEGKRQEELKAKYPIEYEAFWNTPHLYHATTGESFDQLQERVKQFLNRIITEHTDGNVLIVTHSVFIKVLLAHCKSLPLSQLWALPFIHDTSLTLIEIAESQMNIKLEGCIAHRKEESELR